MLGRHLVAHLAGPDDLWYHCCLGRLPAGLGTAGEGQSGLHPYDTHVGENIDGKTLMKNDSCVYSIQVTRECQEVAGEVSDLRKHTRRCLLRRTFKEAQSCQVVTLLVMLTSSSLQPAVGSGTGRLSVYCRTVCGRMTLCMRANKNKHYLYCGYRRSLPVRGRLDRSSKIL